MTGPWKYPPRKHRRTSGFLGRAIIAASLIAMFLLIAPKAMTQAAYDAAACPTLYTVGCTK